MTETPAWSKAVALYANPADYNEDRRKIKHCGHVIESNDLILWGFRTSLEHVTWCVTNKSPVYIPNYRPIVGDAWFVWMLAGNIRRIPQVIPYPLEYIFFARDKKLRPYTYEELVNRIPK